MKKGFLIFLVVFLSACREKQEKKVFEDKSIEWNLLRTMSNAHQALHLASLEYNTALFNQEMYYKCLLNGDEDSIGWSSDFKDNLKEIDSLLRADSRYTGEHMELLLHPPQ